MDSLPFSLADVIVVLILAISAVLAFVRGFVHEVLSFGAWIGAVVAVVLLLPLARPIARGILPTPVVADIATGLVIFLVALVLFSIVTRWASQRVKDSALNAVDRSLGFLFGLVRGAVLVCLLYIPVQWMLPDQEQPAWLREAHARPLMEHGADLIRNLVVPGSAGPATTDAPPRDAGADALDAERLARDIMSPEPKGPEPTESDAEKGYGERERRALDRLIDADQ